MTIETPPTRLVWPMLAPFYARAERLGYPLLRLWFAMTIFTHGYPKLMRVPHGSRQDAYARVVSRIGGDLGLPAPELLGTVVTLLETGGAVLLGIGLLTRIVAPMLAVQMLVIALGLSWPVWNWTDHGMEYPLLMAALAGYIAVRGGGPISVDRLIGREV